MRTLFLLTSIIWALTAPLASPLRIYLWSHLLVTSILETLLLFSATDNFTHLYAMVYWPFIAIVSVIEPLGLLWFYGEDVWTCPKLRILLAAWGFMAIYYYGYFFDMHSARLDYVPTVIYGGAFTLLGLVSRASASRHTVARLPNT